MLTTTKPTDTERGKALHAFNHDLESLVQSEIDVTTMEATSSEVLSLLNNLERTLGPQAGILDVAKPRLLQGGLAPWQFRNVEAYVDTHIAAQIRIENLASICRLSVSHFSRAFKVSFGKAPHFYIMTKRIELAQTLMITTHEPLSQIALFCGLSDQAHLSNLFRRCVGTTPQSWRRLTQRLSHEQTLM
ncbi:helix-turn-helix domain-containing protein [Rhizobium rhizophilum]|uniref:Helix-turn-helix transcriptional regulator n=1 Tax=Rhizobium rhizophilum TaxID=1850373 RepID=A0ABY2QSE2_9HYPH|nr:AraC family transcriptional regulator [Rhizobium rhizophilum]THV12671.1 helix-turn-helix transcriptional regulator [Rhizobium rhizophilum]